MIFDWLNIIPLTELPLIARAIRSYASPEPILGSLLHVALIVQLLNEVEIDPDAVGVTVPPLPIVHDLLILIEVELTRVLALST
jgi:hypothetical protein